MKLSYKGINHDVKSYKKMITAVEDSIYAILPPELMNEVGLRRRRRRRIIIQTTSTTKLIDNIFLKI